MDNPNDKPRLIVYGHDYCGQARLLRAALERQHSAYEWRDVLDGDPRFQEELRRLARGNLSVPTVVFPDGTALVEPWPDAVLNRLRPRPVSLFDSLLAWLKSPLC